MRRLLKLIAAATVAVVAVQLLRWYLEGGPEPFVADREGSGSAKTSTAKGTNSGRPTRNELYQEAKDLQIEGRSKMNKRQLHEAVEAAKTGGRT